MTDTYYRYVDNLASERVTLYRYPVLKTTPQGVWIEYGLGRRWVKTNARKRFACPTIDEAFISYRKRKRRQIGIYKERIRAIRVMLSTLELSR